MVHESCRLAVGPRYDPAFLRDGASRVSGSAAVPAACGPEARSPPNGGESDGLQYLLGRDVGGKDRSPIGATRQDVATSGQLVVGRPYARRGASFLGGLDRPEQQTAHMGGRPLGGCLPRPA